jgi:hypothetical protein
MHDEKFYMDPKRVKSAKSEAAWKEFDAASFTNIMHPLELIVGWHAALAAKCA